MPTVRSWAIRGLESRNYSRIEGVLYGYGELGILLVRDACCTRTKFRLKPLFQCFSELCRR